MNRRSFLLNIGVAFASASAYSFGNSIKPLIESRSEKIALIYGSRYGATEDNAKWVAKGIGSDVDILNIETIDFAETLKKYDKFIIGSGIWIDGAHKRLMELLSTYTVQIESKIIASFIVCGTTGEDVAGKARIEGYFERFHKPLNVKPTLKKHFGGRMTIEQLSEKDRKLLDNFYTNVLKREFKSWDRTNPEQAEKFGLSMLKYS
ncbi:MAG: flavodoxin domain-containing protein [Sulfurovum sp.]|jgi:menaquinone-dependent protoporphyrinogen oxidase|uniref:flavodoxin domain-containing protein n=1 Tax=Sulfurovum sp. TaxID=1969726 RepID=UPI003C722D07